MAAALVLGQDVNLALELGVGVDGAGLAQNLAALDVGLGDTAQQAAGVITGLDEVQSLAEHLHGGDDGALLLLLQAHDVDGLAGLQLAALHTAGSHGAAAGDGEHVLDGHQEGQRVVTGRIGDIAVDGIHQLLDAGEVGVVHVAGLAGQGVQSGALDDGDVVAGELIEGQDLADLHLDQLQQVGVVHLVALVQEDHDGGHAHLTGQQDMLLGLGHGAVGGGDNQDGAVHLSGAGDHVLDIVGVARAVDVGIVPGVGLILHVGGVDGDAALALLGSLVDAGVVLILGLALQSQILGDGGGQGGLAVVHVADGADVYVGLVALKFCLSHFACSSLIRLKCLIVKEKTYDGIILSHSGGNCNYNFAEPVQSSFRPRWAMIFSAMLLGIST